MKESYWIIVISDFQDRRPHRELNSRPFDPKLNTITSQPPFWLWMEMFRNVLKRAKTYKRKQSYNQWDPKIQCRRNILLKSLDKVRTGLAVSISNKTDFSLVYEAAIWPVSVLMNVTEVGLPTSKKKYDKNELLLFPVWIQF